MFLYSGNPNSKGACRLARELGIKRIKHNNSRFSGRRSPYVINWGATVIDLPWKNRVRLLNAPEAVQRVSNKLTFFLDMEDHVVGGFPPEIVPPFTPYKIIAQEWIEKGKKIVCRTILNGHGGIGIHIASTVDELIDAPLYVQYIPKKAEYRVHVFDERVIDVQQKIKKAGQEPLNWQIRSHDNGFIYQRDGVHPNPMVLDVSRNAMAISGLDFGAVDVIWNEHQQRAYVLEINTAPGLEGQTVTSYADAFKELTGE